MSWPKIKYFVFECMTNSLYVSYEYWKHDSRHVIKFVYLRSTSSLAVLHTVSEHDLQQLKKMTNCLPVL
jgi:hypothetical protein